MMKGHVVFAALYGPELQKYYDELIWFSSFTGLLKEVNKFFRGLLKGVISFVKAKQTSVSVQEEQVPLLKDERSSASSFDAAISGAERSFEGFVFKRTKEVFSEYARNGRHATVNPNIDAISIPMENYYKHLPADKNPSTVSLYAGLMGCLKSGNISELLIEIYSEKPLDSRKKNWIRFCEPHYPSTQILFRYGIIF